MSGMDAKHNVYARFRMTGKYPINRDVFSVVDDAPLLKESGLAFIPLYSHESKRTQGVNDKMQEPEVETEDEIESASFTGHGLVMNTQIVNVFG